MRIEREDHQVTGEEEQVIGHLAYSARFSSSLKHNHGRMGVRIEGRPVADLLGRVIDLLGPSHQFVKPLQ